MGKLLKRLSVLMLCVALVVSDNAVSGFAAQLQENPEVISEVTDEAVVIEEEITDEKDVEDEDILELETEIDSENEGIFADEEVVDSNDTIESETAAIEESAVEGTEEEIVATEEVVTTEALNDATYTLKYSVNEDGKTVTITGLEGTASGDLVIPDTIEGYPVTSIGSYAFSACSGFTGDLVIPDSVTSIGVYSFLNCTGFKGNLTIGKNVESIGGHAFCGCKGFTGDLIIPDSVTNIGDGAFYACEGFTGNLTISNSVKIIGNEAFSSCFGFTGDLVIPDSVESIGEKSFEDCKGFTGLTIGNSVKDIGEQAFACCFGFTGVLTIGNSVESIGVQAFERCSGFTGDLTIGNSVKSIGNHAFYGCNGFTGKLTIPQSVESMLEDAFDGCSGLCVVENKSQIAIPLDNTHTWYNADTNDIITSITNGKALMGDDKGPYDEGKTYRIKYEINEDQASVTITGLEGTASGDLVIPDTIEEYPVTSIGDKAFEDCTGFTGSLTIGNNVISIGSYAFSCCSGFTGDLVIPDSVEKVGTTAFADCEGFTGLTIGNSVKDIGDQAFKMCSGFTGDLLIPDSVESIGEEAFANCTGFTGKLTIPQSVKTMSLIAFEGCSGLCVVINDSENEVSLDNTHTWYNADTNDKITSITNGKALIGDDKGPFVEGKKYRIKYEINGDQATVTVTGAEGELEGDLIIPDTIKGYPVTSIGKNAFKDCTGFTGSLTIGKNVVNIRENAFCGCSSLSSIEIPNSVTYISYNAFDGCSSLSSIEIPNSVTYIANYAFKGCSSLSSIEIPDSVIIIDNNVFDGCSNLRSISVPCKFQKKEFYGIPDEVDIAIVHNIPNGTKDCIRVEDSGACGDKATYILLCSGSLVFSGEGAIQGDKFRSNDSIIKVVIESGITGIGDSAFNNCTSLSSIAIPDTVTSIGDSAFNNCTSLSSITIPDSVTSIGNRAFYNCFSFNNIIIPNSVTSIGEDAFYGCRNLNSITIPNSVTSIGENAFMGCTSLNSITIPNSVTSIGVDAFTGCCNLKSIMLPCIFQNSNDLGLDDVEDKVFVHNSPQGKEACTQVLYSGNCGELNQANNTRGNNATYELLCNGTLNISGTGNIGEGAFIIEAMQQQIKSVVIGSGITGIYDDAFNGCSNLSSIEIPTSVTSIGQFTFVNCSSLSSIEIPTSVTSIDRGAFSGCSSLSSIEIPNSVTSISDDTFYNCRNLGSVNIPNSVTSIGENVFAGCSNLSSITMPCRFNERDDLGLESSVEKKLVHEKTQGSEECARVVDSGNCGSFDVEEEIFGDDATYVLKCDRTLTISGNGSIGSGFFANNNLIENVVINSGINTICDGAFKKCENIKSVSIPDTVYSIGDEAFSGCAKIENIEIPNSIRSIGENVFAGCSNLSSITMPCRFNERDDLGLESSVEKKLVHEKTQGSEECARVVDSGNCGPFDEDEGIFGDNATYVLKCERTLTVSGNGFIGSGFFANNNLIENVVINSGINSICDGAFKKCENIKSVSIPDTVYAIGDEAFSGCAKIENIEIPNSIRSIGSYAFNNCTSLTSITIPDSVTSIGKFAFVNCSSLSSIEIPNSVTSINDNTFYNCSNLGSVTIPNSVTSIGSYAFNNCTSLTSITIPDSVKDIDEGAFIGCSGLCVVINNSEIEVPLDNTHIWYNAETNEQITSIKNGKALIGDDEAPFAEGKTYRLEYEVNDDQASVTIKGVKGDSEGNLIIPDTIAGYPVTSIGEKAFESCNGFTGELVIPDSVTYIGNDAFKGCEGFTGSLTIGNNVTYIGDNAFNTCYGFTGCLTIPDSVTYIGNSAFYGCGGFTGDLVIPDSITYIGNVTFYGCGGFTGDLVIPDSITYIGNVAFYDCKGFTGDLVIPDSVTYIGNGAFEGCKGFTGDLVIPDSITYIGNSAFRDCKGFTGDLVIPDSITYIEKSAFRGCSGFTGSLKLPDSVISIGNCAFEGCSGFTGDLVIPDSVTSILSSAFEGCSGFTGDLVIPDSVTSILSSAFKDCTGFDGYYLIIDSNWIDVVEAKFTGVNFADILTSDELFWIKPISEQTYTGKAIVPGVEVYNGAKKLALNKDYSLKITKNTNCGEALVTVTGKGNYTGVETATFRINAKNINDADMAADDIVIKSTGRDQKPKPVLKWNGKAVAATKYTYQYFAATVNEDGTWTATGDALTAVKDAGKYVIVITPKEGGNFTETRTVKVTLTDNTQKLVSTLAITAIKAQPYTGSAIEPVVTVKSGKMLLTRSEDGVTGDYTVEYKNNTAVGTATVVIKGVGDYVGTKTTTFKITGTPLSKATVKGITTMTYTGNPIRLNNLKLYIKATKTTSQIDLKRGIDYTVDYTNNLKAGTATVTFKGINGYTGTVKKKFKISAIKYANATDKFRCTFVDSEVDENGITYSKGGAKPAIEVTFINADGTTRTLVEKTDYTVAYSNNTAVNNCSNEKKLPTVKVTLKGSYSGTITKTYKITAKDISSVKINAADKTYVKKAGAYKSAVKLTDTDGKVLAAGKDYNATIEYSVIRDEQKVVLGSKDIVNAGEVVNVKVTAKENGNYTGEITTSYRVTNASISSAKVVKIKTQLYAGKAITLTKDDITIKLTKNGEELECGTDYEIVEGSYKKNINKGTASVTIRGIGNYGGTRKVDFTIKSKTILW